MMSDHERLGRSYRRLLWAYPRHYRRARGEEMVSLLLDAAGPGQRRPSLPDATNLVLRGVAARLAVPRGPAYAAAAVVAALFGGVLLSASATAVALRHYPWLATAQPSTVYWFDAGRVVLVLVGAIGAWLLVGRALRGFRRFGLRGRLLLAAIGGPGLLLALWPSTGSALALVLGGPQASARELVHIGLMPPVAAMAGSLLLLAALLAEGAPRPADPVAATRLPPLRADLVYRLLAWASGGAHLLVALTTGLVIAAYLVISDRAGLRPLTGQYDPKNYVPFGPEWYNPLYWVFIVVYLTYLIGWLVSAGLLVFSVPLLVAGRVLGLARVGRVWYLLLAGVAVAVVPAALLLTTDLGRETTTWMLD
jgi:hypothetical protein